MARMRESAELRPRHKFFVAVVAALIGMIAAIGVVNVGSSPASAADLSKFRPGNIISDSVFFDSGTMTEAQIQSFLNSKVSKCSAGYSCLKDHTQATTTRAADAMCAGYTGASSESAARIIHKVARSCGINPQVILVMLQKEQGLVLDSSPSSWAWTASMGYACPDTAACDTRYYGFFNQVYMGIWQLKRYGNPPGTSNYFTWFPVGKAAPIRFSPNAACGSANVTVENKATASLYYYTPYQPNSAALASGYGASGDPCSAYGNRNFFNYFSDWFGLPTGPVNPFGNVEVVSGEIGKIRVAGWAIDPNTTAPIDVHVYVDGVGKSFTANFPRADVGGAYPASGSNHGFDVSIPTSAGTHSVCVYGMNSGAGGNVLFGCWDATTPGGNPVGIVDTITASTAGIKVSGWALDPDVVAPIAVHVYVGEAGTAITANSTRTGIDTQYAAYGSNHGFSTTIPASAGPHTVCVYGINQGTGGHTQFSCSTVTVPAATSGITEKGRVPVGSLDSVTADATGISVSGWTLDPDTTSSIQAHVYIDETGKALVADQARTDLPTQYAAYGTKHGFSDKLQASAGNHTVCAYGINTGPGGHIQLGCKAVTVPIPPTPAITEQGRVPVGALETVTADATGISVSGWALDPDTASSIQVHIYVGEVGKAFLADQARADLPAPYYAAYGTKHGFAARLQAAAGSHAVCAYGINTGAGGHVQLGCKTVTVPAATSDIAEKGRVPFGNFETLSTATGSVSVAGWAIDPDTSASIPVHVYVGAAGTALTASASRPDVAAHYPGYGDKHGFAATLGAAPGPQTVCAYAINTGPGGHVLLGCKSITVAAPAATITDQGRAPIGALDSVTATASGFQVSGWAIDPDTTSPITVHLYVGTVGVAVPSNGSRPDVGAVYPAYGSQHGFSAALPAPAGTSTVCAYGMNTGAGGHTQLGCKTVTR